MTNGTREAGFLAEMKVPTTLAAEREAGSGLWSPSPGKAAPVPTCLLTGSEQGVGIENVDQGVARLGRIEHEGDDGTRRPDLRSGPRKGSARLDGPDGHGRIDVA